MKNITYSCFKWIFTSIVCILLSSCNDFLSSIKNENTQEISTLLYKLDDIDVCMNGAYGAFCSSSYYDYIKFSELVGSDCSTSTLNSSILPSFDVVSRENNFYKYISNIDDYQAGLILQWGSFVNNNSNLVIKSISEKLPPIVTKKDSLNAERLLGEAYLMRASVEFYNNFFIGRQYHSSTLDSLSTLYRKRPILNIKDVAEPRKTVSQVYGFLIEDLKKAQILLPDKYDNLIHTSAYQYRCKKDVATAMLAKVYFQANKFDSALVEVNRLLGNNVGISTKFPLLQGSSYLKIYQTTDKTNYQPQNGSEIIMAFHGNSAFLPTSISKWNEFKWTAPKNLQNGDISQCKFLIVMDTSLQKLWLKGDTTKDLRFKQLVYISNNKGKESPAKQWFTLKAAFPTSNIPWLRATEFHLMRAEIYLHLNNIPFSLIELNLIRTRAGLTEIAPNTTKDEIYQNIIEERCREFCFENVRRWDNIRLASLSGTSYGTYLPEPYKSGFIPLGNRQKYMSESILPWNSNRLYCQLPINEYEFNPALNK